MDGTGCGSGCWRWWCRRGSRGRRHCGRRSCGGARGHGRVRGSTSRRGRWLDRGHCSDGRGCGGRRGRGSRRSRGCRGRRRLLLRPRTSERHQPCQSEAYQPDLPPVAAHANRDCLSTCSQIRHSCSLHDSSEERFGSIGFNAQRGAWVSTNRMISLDSRCYLGRSGRDFQAAGKPRMLRIGGNVLLLRWRNDIDYCHPPYSRPMMGQGRP